MDNRTIAHRLTSHAHELEMNQESLFRVRAYRRAAETILRLDRPVCEIVRESGKKALRRLPGIGAHISLTIEDLLGTAS